VGKSILLFALPLLGSSLIQQLYSTVDLIFVGHLLGTESSAAIGASDLLITCMIGFFNGMAVGTSVITAQLFGGKNWDGLRKLIHTIFLVGICGGLFLMAFGIGFTPFFLRKMGTPDAILNLSTRYLRIYMLSMVSIVLYNLLSGVIRSLGDSKTPMLFQALGGFINILGDFLFLYVFRMGVEGTAIATFASQTFAAVLVICYLYRMKTPYALRFFSHAFDGNELGKVLRVGVPSGIQSIVITLSNILIQSQINTLGVSSIAAFTVYFKTELIVYLPILALGQAVVSFVGQNYGAGNTNRIKKGNRFCMIGGSIFTFLFAFCLLLASPVLLHIFTKDAEVVRLGCCIMRITFPFYFLYTILECLSSNLRGHGKALLPMVVTIISFCGFRLLLLFLIMGSSRSIQSVAMTYPVSWAFAVLLLSGVSLYEKRKFAKRNG
jgi:putative MATE family efflux protein